MHATPMTTHHFFGVDPGNAGGIAVLNIKGQVVRVHRRPTDLLELGAIFHLPPDVTGVGMIEFVRSSPQMGVVSAFTFGRGLGELEMALTAARIQYWEVLPRKWQDTFECRSHGDKNITKAKAVEMFPSALWLAPELMPITHHTADALLIAEFCRRSFLARHATRI